MEKIKSKKNKTISLNASEISKLKQSVIHLSKPVKVKEIENKTINGDVFEVIKYLPDSCVDLLILDPPYNIYKNFKSTKFKSVDVFQYAEWLEELLVQLKRILKPAASAYICGDWFTSISIPIAASKHLIIQNRITWEREKGRGSKKNWKNSSEDIWFCTLSKKYNFNADGVKLQKKVIAPYRDEKGVPKDWQIKNGQIFRLTYPSNIWNDISVPFWSMPENTEHPTQKPEKLIAKLIIASSKKGDFVFDPFLGSGTTSVVAKKLGRIFCGIEIDEHYALLTEKRLLMAENEASIQGYDYGYFWERNTNPFRITPGNSKKQQ